MGHWYNPPPPVQPQVHAPVAAAWSNVAPNPIGSGAPLAAILSSWPQESWPAQSGDIVASQLATAMASPPQPRPFYGTRPLDALIPSTWPQESWPAQSGAIVASQLATALANPQPQPFYGTRPLDALIRSIWPPESWTSQVLTGGGVGAISAAVTPAQYAPAGPLAKAVATAINAAWPPEQWGAQIAGRTASLLAVVTTPVIFPSPLRVLGAAIASTWLPESWYAQSESGIASGIAQIQLPPLYQPWSTTSRMALLRSAWLPEDWPAQAGARYAAWIPLPVTLLPSVIRHQEFLLWPADTWAAQPGTRNASIFGTAPAALPYVNRWLSAALRSAWGGEDWPAQTFPDLAGGQSPLVPPAPRSPSQLTISLWPLEFWGAQSGTRGAAILATPQLLLFMPNVVGELQNVAIAQLQSLFAAVITLQYVFSGAPPEIVVAQSIPKGTLVFPGEAVTLQISLGRQIGPAPCPIVESIVVSNIPVILSILPPNKTVIH